MLPRQAPLIWPVGAEWRVSSNFSSCESHSLSAVLSLDPVQTLLQVQPSRIHRTIQRSWNAEQTHGMRLELAQPYSLGSKSSYFHSRTYALGRGHRIPFESILCEICECCRLCLLCLRMCRWVWCEAVAFLSLKGSQSVYINREDPFPCGSRLSTARLMESISWF